ncbi:helix-turn-helix domain-containing protein [Nakamurella lactea]|uniref:helix-turn-helix domain-containing protein n=1 Tax=Nakamurella lactea TaxID=459515 RepID=UPI0004227A38|nr:helix-turn-helix transcriptional regulator [Nakamurella lactea]
MNVRDTTDLRDNAAAEQQSLDLLAGLVRRARRLADVSQRELAERAGVGKSSVARAERGREPISLTTFVRLISATGLTLALSDQHGDPVAPMRSDAITDRGGRYYPAHLDPESTSISQRVAGLERARPIPRLSFHRRDVRDRRRARRQELPADHPGPENVQHQLNVTG